MDYLIFVSCTTNLNFFSCTTNLIFSPSSFCSPAAMQFDLESELVTTVANTRNGTQRALKYITEQYRRDSVQSALQTQIQHQLSAAAARGEDQFAVIDAGFRKIIATETPFTGYNYGYNPPPKAKYNEDCLQYGHLLRDKSDPKWYNQKTTQQQPKWAADLCRHVKHLEELHALSFIAESMNIKLYVHTENNFTKYVFDWKDASTTAYYKIVKGPTDAYTQYDLNEIMV